MIKQNKLIEKFDYNEDTGLFTWKCGKRAGIAAGHISSSGYVVLSVGTT
jgi:hypothetical protein